VTSLTDDRDAWSMENCPIVRAFETIGSRSAVAIMREVFFGTRRFDDFARRTGIGDAAVAARLRELTAAGLLERVPYQEPGQRKRFEYRATAKGQALLPVLTALREWGDTWTGTPDEVPLLSVHRGCGSTVRARLRCDNGHEVDPSEVEVTAGPGLIRV
jgi:DNA-binding HxlR family transcriptional regulator